MRATAASMRSRTRRRQSQAKSNVTRTWMIVVITPVTAPSPMSPRNGSTPTCPLPGDPPSVITLPSITFSAGITMSWPKRTRSLEWSSDGSGGSGASGVSGWSASSIASPRAALARSRAVRTRLDTVCFPSSMTRTEIPSSSAPAFGTLSTAALDVAVFDRDFWADAGAGRRSARASSSRKDAAAIQVHANGLVRTIRSEREANMAHTPFVATGWSQHDVERESQGDEDGARDLDLGRSKRNDRGARQRTERLERDPDLIQERHVDRDPAGNPLQHGGHSRDRAVDGRHQPDVGIGETQAARDSRQVCEDPHREHEAEGAHSGADPLPSGVQESARRAELADDAALERSGDRVELHLPEQDRLAPKLAEDSAARGARSRVALDHARDRGRQRAVDQRDQLALAGLAGKILFHGFAPRTDNFRLRISCARCSRTFTVPSGIA